MITNKAINNTVNNASPNKSANKTNSNTSNQNKNKTNSVTENVNKISSLKINDWRVVIPSIGLNAQIGEGTSTEVMNELVGHFENTSLWNGNIALAAHNRGYPVNYFANIKNLKKGAEIQYYYNGNVKQYRVETVTIIKDTDWTYLENTKENKITLITCVENEPEYRRCIQGIEI